MSRIIFENPYEKATVKYKVGLIGCIAKHLFVFTPEVSHYHAFDSRRPNEPHGLTGIVGHISKRVTPMRRCYPDTVFDLLKYSKRTG